MKLISYDSKTNSLIKSLNYDDKGNLISTPEYIQVDDDFWDRVSIKYHIDDFCIIDNKLAISKNTLVQECINTASNNIYNAYPIYAQQNLNSDCTYSINIIAVELGLSTETIYGKVYKFLGSDLTHDTLLTMKNNIATINISPLISGVAIDIYGITNAYRTVLYSVLSYKLMKFVRDWCNNKKSIINNCTTAEELNAITFEDCPSLS